MKKSVLLMAVGALAFAACGEGGSAQVGGGDETGGLRVNVLDMTEANVLEMHMTVTADAGVVGNRAVTQSNIVLTRTSAVGGNPAVWEHTATAIPVGDYKIQAFAFNSIGAVIGTNTPTFSSVEVDVKVTSGGTAIANIFLRQNIDDPDFNTPYITSVVFDRTPAFYQTTEITVTGAQGAAGNLTLHAQGDGTFDTVSGATWVVGTGDAKTAGATIDWLPKDPTTPGVAENQLVTVRLTDSAGNDTSLKMTINVDHERGEIEFNITFNEAPSIAVTTSIVNEATGNVVTMTAGYTDPEYPTEDVTYTWDVEDCVTAGFSVVPAPTTGVVSGTIDGDGTTHQVTLTLTPGAGLPTPPPTCSVTIEVEDQGISDGASGWVTDSESSRTKVIHLTVGTVAPTVSGP